MGGKCQLGKGTFLYLKLRSLHPYIYIYVCVRVCVHVCVRVCQTKSLRSIFTTVYIQPSLKIKIQWHHS